jgi:hypothetical protein
VSFFVCKFILFFGGLLLMWPFGPFRKIPGASDLERINLVKN